MTTCVFKFSQVLSLCSELGTKWWKGGSRKVRKGDIHKVKEEMVSATKRGRQGDRQGRKREKKRQNDVEGETNYIEHERRRTTPSIPPKKAKGNGDKRWRQQELSIFVGCFFRGSVLLPCPQDQAINQPEQLEKLVALKPTTAAVELPRPAGAPLQRGDRTYTADRVMMEQRLLTVRLMHVKNAVERQLHMTLR